MLGYSAGHVADQQALEAQFDQQLDPADLRTWLLDMASAPNQVGSPHDKHNAETMLAQFKSWGWDAQIETFYVLYPTPLEEQLELVAPTHFVASLKEPPVVGDASSSNTAGALPPYNVFAADGDVTAALVYVNQGMPDDYKELARRGIDVKGKIAIARYGGGWRGLKPKLAQEHGAVGCLIYSDPSGDGYGPGDVYPKGGFRPADGVQRGSVLDIPVASGDPLTPDIGATKNAKRLAIADAKTILKIPVLPISYADAQPLLAALEGPVAPKDWRGGLPITYHIGGGAAQVHLQLKSEWSLKPIYDVVAKMRGSELPDEWVIRGNHHDGWVFGAWDPLSGNVALLEEAKAIGALRKTGWKPKRTLVYASWDAEEPGLLGSTEWAEAHAEELKKKAVLYINADTNTRGFLNSGGSHPYQHLVNEIAAGIRDPETGVSVLQRQRAHQLVEAYGSSKEEDKARAVTLNAGGDVPIDALGSGSDFSPFLQHLGVAALDLSYSGEDDQAGVYHSVYDSFEHYVRFGDPNFAYGIALAQTIGHTMLRVADADVLPMQFGALSQTFADYVQELHKLADNEREHALKLNKLLDQNAFQLADDPTRSVLPPARESEVPALDFVALDAAVKQLQASTKAYDDAYAQALTAPEHRVPRAELDRLLQNMEQQLTVPEGLPGREWYRHLIYAPGFYTGYGVKTMPGVREAIEQRHWDEANKYAGITAATLSRYSQQLDRATQLLKP
ncbi:MAG: folate hydrolase [Nevskia sp.]|nr:folate hydrolase [Nevskia sp.]